MSSSSSPPPPVRVVLLGDGGSAATSQLIEQLPKEDICKKLHLPHDSLELWVISDSKRGHFPDRITMAVAGMCPEHDTFFDLEVFAARRGWTFMLARFVCFFCFIFRFHFSFSISFTFFFFLLTIPFVSQPESQGSIPQERR